MICVVLSVGVVHSATQCNVNAKRFRNCSIYCKNTYSASGHKPSLLPRDNCTVSSDVTPSVAVCTDSVHFRPQATPDVDSDYILSQN